MTSLDVQAGQTVTFDSYAKEDGSRYTAYGKYQVSRDGKDQSRTYDKLFNGQFSILKLKRIERKSDPNNISNKVFDFSSRTISDLIKIGYDETTSHLNRM